MTINCAGKLIDLSTPKIMGILNITPDSFYDGGKYDSDKKILKQVEKMINDGASQFYEVGPGNVLIGLNRRINREIPSSKATIEN